MKRTLNTQYNTVFTHFSFRSLPENVREAASVTSCIYDPSRVICGENSTDAKEDTAVVAAGRDRAGNHGKTLIFMNRKWDIVQCEL